MTIRSNINMIKDITLGQYYSVNSLLHRLDPRVKIRFTIIYIILLLLDRNIMLFSFLTLVFMFAAIISRVPFAHILKGCKGLFFLVLFCSAINIFTTTGAVLWEFGSINVTREGLIKFGFVVWRVVLMMLTASIMMYTTTPTELTDGFEKCFHLSGNVAMGITIALRFVSVLFEELDRIMKAQEARGANFHSGGPVRRLKNLRNVIVPLFQNSIDRAGHLGEAMDARCYTGGKGRTKLKPLVYDGVDMISYLIITVVIIVSLFLIVKF